MSAVADILNELAEVLAHIAFAVLALVIGNRLLDCLLTLLFGRIRCVPLVDRRLQSCLRPGGITLKALKESEETVVLAHVATDSHHL